jgi:hypothetical protein
MANVLSPETFLSYLGEMPPTASNADLARHVVKRFEADHGHTLDLRAQQARVARWRASQPSPDAIATADEHAQHAAIGAAPPGHRIKGTSTLTGADGAIRARWVKTQTDPSADHLQSLEEGLRGILGQYKPLKPAKAPKSVNADLLTVYPMGDPHVGMLSWHMETGKDWDLQIAEQTMVSAVDHLVSVAPPSERALILNLGDFFHADDQTQKTKRSGNVLDVDGRHAKVVHVGLRTMRRIIDRALKKHQSVEVWNVIGNHDDNSALWLSITLAHLYEQEPRVTVNTSPSKFYYQRFGKCLIAATHGDTVKRTELNGVMMCDRPKDVGKTKARYWYTGHVHHERVVELPGCVVESFRTLAPGDAWHHAEGYRSGRDMRCDVWHREHGRINRHIVGVERLSA